jgi:tetraacyldisaccharide 4'-kinase
MMSDSNVLGGLSLPLEAVNAVVHFLYANGALRTHRAVAPVLSIGNIAIGGTGKTPLVAALARELVARGRRPAILTRGYRRRGHEPVVAVGHHSLPWDVLGDEPALLSRALPDVPVVVDPDRVRGASTAVTSMDADVLLLDDGFQHWRLGRDVDVAAVDARDPLCRQRPRRESPRALRRADAIVVTGAERGNAAEAMLLLAEHAPRALLTQSTNRATSLHRGEERLDTEALRGARVLAVAGIASPERFFATLEDLGAVLVECVRRPDHHVHTAAEVRALLARASARDAEIVMTAKDAIKLPTDLAAAVSWLEIESVLRPNDLTRLLGLLPGAAGLEFRT